jgi:hypothetical protein
MSVCQSFVHGHGTDKGLMMFIVIKVLQIKYGVNDVFKEPHSKNVKVIHTQLLCGIYHPMFVYVCM